MKLGVVNPESWAFFNEIYQEFLDHHETTIFSPRQVNPPLFAERINRFLGNKDFGGFLKRNEVVFFEWASEFLAAASHMPKSCGLVARMHRYELYQWADRIKWEHVDRLIVVSEAKRREFTRRYPDCAANVTVIPEAISVDKFAYQQKEFSGQLGILCHLSPRKRVYELILAYYELLQRGNELHLHIGGSGHGRHPDYEPALHALVSDLKIADQVTFYGKVSDPVKWYSKIDVFVSNSYSEGLQVSPMEAIASGCLCIAHAWPGSRELLPEEQIFRSEREFIQLVESLYTTPPETLLGWQQRQLQRVRTRFNINQIKIQVREQIEEVAYKRTRTKNRA